MPSSNCRDAVFLESHSTAVQGRTVTATYDLVVVDQREGGQDYSRPASHAFTSSSLTLGYPQLISLEQLKGADRAYLKDDRLVTRVDIRVTSVVRGAAA